MGGENPSKLRTLVWNEVYLQHRYPQILQRGCLYLIYLPFSHSFGQFLASTLPTETSVVDILIEEDYGDNQFLKDHQRNINQRNSMLDVLSHLIIGDNKNGLDLQ